MNDNSTWLILVAMVGVALAVFLFGGMPVDVGSETPVAVQQPQQVSVPRTVVQQAAVNTPLRVPSVVDAGLNVTLNERESVRLHGSAQNVGNGALAYHWSAEGRRGSFDNPFQQNPVYTAPSVCGCDECITLTLTVTDAVGVHASDQVYVRVRGDPLNCGTPQVASRCYERPNPCWTPPRVDRCQPERPPCESPCIQHITIPTCNVAPVPCCVSPCGWVPRYPLPKDNVTVAPADRPSPLILRSYPGKINEAGSVKLHGRVTNPACADVCFSWKASKGTFEDADTLTPSYRAPQSNRFGGEDVTITLTIHDEYGYEAYDQIRIHINNLNYSGSPAASSSNNWLMRRP